MSSSPIIQILGFTVEDLTIKPRPTFDFEKPPVCRIEISFAMGAAEEPHSFGVRLITRFHDELEEKEDRAPEMNLPYDLRVVLSGVFVTPVQLFPEPDVVPETLANNALVMLYGAMRGFVAQATASFENGSFFVPSVVFNDMVRRASLNEGSGVSPDPSFIEQDAEGSRDVLLHQVSVANLRWLLNQPSMPKALAEKFDEFLSAASTLPKAGYEALEHSQSSWAELKEKIDGVAGFEGVVASRFVEQAEPGLHRVWRIVNTQLKSEAKPEK